MTDYVELHARSAFSFLEGASLPEFLMQQAADLEMPAMALLDRNGVYGAPRFHMEGQKRGVRAHIGAEIAVSDLGQRLRPASVSAASASGRACAAAAAGGVTHRLSEPLPPHYPFQAARETRRPKVRRSPATLKSTARDWCV